MKRAMRDRVGHCLTSATNRRALITAALSAVALGAGRAVDADAKRKCNKACKARKRAAQIAKCQAGLPGLLCPGCAPGSTPFCTYCLSHIDPAMVACCNYAPSGQAAVEACLCQVIGGC